MGQEIEENVQLLGAPSKNPAGGSIKEVRRCRISVDSLRT